MQIKWREKPQKNNYTAAVTYLSLTMEQMAARSASRELKNSTMTEYAAKDIFRASGLSLLGISNSHVETDIAKIACNKNCLRNGEWKRC